MPAGKGSETLPAEEGNDAVMLAVLSSLGLPAPRDTDPRAILDAHDESHFPQWKHAHAVSLKEEKCGSPRQAECSLNYDLAQINASVLAIDATASAAENNAKHKHAREVCGSDNPKAVQDTGGWCYSEGSSVQVTAGGRVSGCNMTGLLNQCNESDVEYLLPEFHIVPDPVLVDAMEALIHILDGRNGPLGPTFSMADFGAGVGQLGHALKRRLPDVSYQGYDAGGNVEEFTKDFVKFADLTTPLSLPRAEWVYTSEVGEHIPNSLESEFIRNMHATNCRGVILSWAHVGQRGHAHINCHSTDYLTHVFEELGYRKNDELTMLLRGPQDLHDQRYAYWLAENFLVLERITKPQGCA